MRWICCWRKNHRTSANEHTAKRGGAGFSQPKWKPCCVKLLSGCIDLSPTCFSFFFSSPSSIFKDPPWFVAVLTSPGCIRTSAGERRAGLPQGGERRNWRRRWLSRGAAEKDGGVMGGVKEEQRDHNHSLKVTATWRLIVNLRPQRHFHAALNFCWNPSCSAVWLLHLARIQTLLATLAR